MKLKTFIRYSNPLLFFVALVSTNIEANYLFGQTFEGTNKNLICEYLAQEAEKKYQLPQNILLSISRVESGYKKVDGVVRSWPWTLNAGGDSAFFKSKNEAMVSLKKRIKKGVTNIDIGCMQLNYRWHNKFFNSLDNMMEPIKNVAYGARFLKKLYQRHGTWEKAIKYYHSSKSKFNVKYYKKVKTVWNRENNHNSLKPILVASGSKVEQAGIKTKEVVPIIKMPNIKNTKKKQVSDNLFDNKEVIKVSATQFEKLENPELDFDFRSFVTSVSKKNTALPKYIRDNWTIVLSIRNQLNVND